MFTRPDPFEDIPAPRLLRQRPGAAPSVAKPHTILQPATSVPDGAGHAPAVAVLRLTRADRSTHRFEDEDPGPALEVTAPTTGDVVVAEAPEPASAAPAAFAEAAPDIIDAAAAVAAAGPLDPAAETTLVEVAAAADTATEVEPEPESPDERAEPFAAAEAPPKPAELADGETISRPTRKARTPRPNRRPGEAASATALTAARAGRPRRTVPSTTLEPLRLGAETPMAPKAEDAIDLAASPKAPAGASRGAVVASPRPPMSSDLLRGIIAGLVVAVALVVLALMMRPTVVDGAAGAAATAVPTDITSAPVPDPAQAAVAATPVSGIAVRLRLGPDQPDSYRDALSAAVEASGYASVEVRAMPYPIDRPRIQFYDPADRSAAEALARSLAPVTGGLIETRDLAQIAEAHEVGSIDAWLAGPPPTP